MIRIFLLIDVDETGADVPASRSVNKLMGCVVPEIVNAADAKTTGDWTVIVRDDGSKQWAYKGKPLYKWMDDHKPGEVDGDGRNNVWHVASP